MLKAREKFAAIGGLSTDGIYQYGFEVPMGTTDSSIYKANDQSNLFSLVDDTDLVCYVAPSAFGFKRYGNIVSTRGGTDGVVDTSEFLKQLICSVRIRPLIIRISLLRRAILM